VSESDIRVILAALARVETKVEAIQADNVRGETVHQDHELRLRSLERVRWVIVGACLAAGGTGGAALTKLLG
jgi:hypothetical protein